MSRPKSTICVVEDDAAIRRGIADSLRFAGYEVLECEDGPSARSTIDRAAIDLVLLDVMLPGMDGLDYLGDLRASKPRLPVIMVTARGTEEDRVRGLRDGADDYVVKPFSATELIARVEAVLRRTSERPLDVSSLSAPGCTIDLGRREVTFEAGEVKALTEREAALLGFLARHPTRAIQRDEILRCVWGLDPRGLDTRTVDMTIARIREKCGKDTIRTLRGEGYIISADVEPKA